MMGVSGSNGESVPNATMNPVFFFELVQTTFVPTLTQNSWLFRALGILGLTLEELTDRVMSTVHGEDAEPHVFAVLHMLSGCGSSQAYLLFFCASAKVGLRAMHNHKHAETEKVCFEKHFINMALPHFHSWILTELPGIFPELELQVSFLLAYPRGPFPT